jgi:hypothetical protein
LFLKKFCKKCLFNKWYKSLIFLSTVFYCKLRKQPLEFEFPLHPPCLINSVKNCNKFYKLYKFYHLDLSVFSNISKEIWHDNMPQHAEWHISMSSKSYLLYRPILSLPFSAVLKHAKGGLIFLSYTFHKKCHFCFMVKCKILFF